MSQKERAPKHLTEVWGDTVALKELLLACLLGVIFTMTFFFVGQYIFHGMEGLDAGMADGYALLVGMAGCILSGVLNARLFKPKRNFEGELQSDSVEEVLRTAGMTVEEEAAALAVVDSEIIAELEDLHMYSLLALIPEDSKNYKPEYKEKARSGSKIEE